MLLGRIAVSYGSTRGRPPAALCPAAQVMRKPDYYNIAKLTGMGHLEYVSPRNATLLRNSSGALVDWNHVNFVGSVPIDVSDLTVPTPTPPTPPPPFFELENTFANCHAHKKNSSSKRGPHLLPCASQNVVNLLPLA